MHTALRQLQRGFKVSPPKSCRQRRLYQSAVASQPGRDAPQSVPGREAAGQTQLAQGPHQPPTAAQPQSQGPWHAPPQVPSILELLSTHGARLTTAAQMVWAQVLQPGDVAVDATCGNGHDSLFMAQCIGATGQLHAVDVQAAAVEATRQLLHTSLPPEHHPQLHLHQGCHSQLQAQVGSNVATLVAFNLGYLPGGDKGVITRTDTTLAAVEAALEVVRRGGLISIMAYVGHPGGLDEYEAVKGLLSSLSPTYWTSSELRLLNRPSAPVLLLLWRRLDAADTAGRAGAGAGAGAGGGTGKQQQ